MEKLLMFMMILASTLMLWVRDVEIAVMDRAYRTVQYGLEHAVHDATLMTDKEDLAKGEIKFIETMAEDALRASLQRNMPVDSLLRPISSTFLESPLIINELIYIDHDYISPDTMAMVQFPFMFKYTLPSGKVFERAIFGPSIVLVMDVNVKGSDGYIPKLVIQEYKGEFLK
jgi:hypothetical protein